MNINIGAIQAEIEASRDILNLGVVVREVCEAILLPSEGLPGVYEVWFATDRDTFLHVQSDGLVVEQTEVLPEHFR